MVFLWKVLEILMMRHCFVSLLAVVVLSGCQKRAQVEQAVEQPMPDLQITNVTENVAGDGKVLTVDVQAKKGAQVDATRTQVSLYIYEKSPTGAVALTSARIVPEWLGLPVDWKDTGVETLQVTYPGPKVGTGGTFYGYVLAVYEDGKLLDFRSQPADLVKSFPLPQQAPGH